VARSVISDLLARVGPAPVQQALPATGNTESESESEHTVAEPEDTEATNADLLAAAGMAVAPPVDQGGQ
jgi:hypothetical protein